MAKKICRNCGYYGSPGKTSSFIGELFVWALFIFLAIAFSWTIIFPIIFILVPIFYTLYRFFSGTRFFCPSCKAQSTMVSIKSPIGKELYERYYNKDKEK